jgi:hypothetical protein
MEAITTFQNESFDPGASNREIARVCAYISDNLKIPMVVQWEIACALDPAWLQAHPDMVHCIWPDGTGYFSTDDLIKGIMRIASDHDWHNPILVAQDHHLTRAYLIFKKNGFSPIITTYKVRAFDKNSIQPWTRGLVAWLIREIPVRLHHWINEIV